MYIFFNLKFSFVIAAMKVNLVILNSLASFFCGLILYQSISIKLKFRLNTLVSFILFYFIISLKLKKKHKNASWCWQLYEIEIKYAYVLFKSYIKKICIDLNKTQIALFELKSYSSLDKHKQKILKCWLIIY